MQHEAEKIKTSLPLPTTQEECQCVASCQQCMDAGGGHFEHLKC
jgi:hypothetical protein